MPASPTTAPTTSIRPRLDPASPLFAVLLGAMSAMAPFATDLALPALDQIHRRLDTSVSLSGLTISLFMAGFATTPLIYGPLSDRIGRKPVLIAGLLVFALASLVCAVAPSIAVLLAARLVEGAGAGAGVTMAFAIVRDLFDGDAARTRLSLITVVLNCAPVIAPSLGALLLAVGDWRLIYAVLALLGFVTVAASAFGYRESRKPAVEKSRSILDGYRRVFANRRAIAHVLIFGFGFGAAFSYISGSSLVLIGLYHVSPGLYGALFACTALGIVAGAGLNGLLSSRGLHHLPLMPLALGGMALAALAVTILAATLPVAPLVLLVPLFVLTTFFFGIVAPNASHGTLDAVPEAAGVASGLLAAFQMICATLASALVSLLFPRLGLTALGVVMLAFAVASIAALVWLRRGRS